MRRPYLLSAVSLLLHISGYVCTEIIGGNVVAPHSRPYMAFLKYPGSCGGALIKTNWVITAAHCDVVNATKVILGAHSLSEDSTKQQQFRIKRAVKHPCFDWESRINDIQLLQLDKPAKLNEFVKILELPKKVEKFKAGTKCSTAGWGATDMKKLDISDVLREVNLETVSNKTCIKAYSNQNLVITSSMICAGPLKRSKGDACQGDSGGPLICNNQFAGIVSFGYKCGDPKYPGVYTRLTAKYLAWIKDTTGGATF